MAQNFERLTIWEDPYDIMCGECEVHTYETWNPATLEELKTDYEMEKTMPLFDPEMPETPDTFEEWLEQSIRDGYIRIAE